MRITQIFMVLVMMCLPTSTSTATPPKAETKFSPYWKAGDMVVAGVTGAMSVGGFVLTSEGIELLALGIPQGAVLVGMGQMLEIGSVGTGATYAGIKEYAKTGSVGQALLAAGRSVILGQALGKILSKLGISPQSTSEVTAKTIGKLLSGWAGDGIGYPFGADESQGSDQDSSGAIKDALNKAKDEYGGNADEEIDIEGDLGDGGPENPFEMEVPEIPGINNQDVRIIKPPINYRDEDGVKKAMRPKPGQLPVDPGSDVLYTPDFAKISSEEIRDTQLQIKHFLGQPLNDAEVVFLNRPRVIHRLKYTKHMIWEQVHALAQRGGSVSKQMILDQVALPVLHRGWGGNVDSTARRDGTDPNSDAVRRKLYRWIADYFQAMEQLKRKSVRR